MNAQEIKMRYTNFLDEYKSLEKDQIWVERSEKFRNFWKEKIMSNGSDGLNEEEVDEIIRILSSRSKGHLPTEESVGNVMIPQGVWRRLFANLKEDEKLKNALTKVFNSEGDRCINELNSLSKLNAGLKNSLTGKNGNAIGAMLFAYNPNNWLSEVSIQNRIKIIESFGFGNIKDFEKLDWGQQIFKSNKLIIEGFRAIEVTGSPRTISRFLWGPGRQYWRPTEEIETGTEAEEEDTQEDTDHGESTHFYEEKDLENYLIVNWEKTELGKKYDLIMEDGQLKSQQYYTDIGKIDILVQRKDTKQYVVIELKKDQSSDKTVGQIARYMGWVREKRALGKPVFGIIIAKVYDEQLKYAVKMVPGVEVFLYDVSVKLTEFKV